jgi:hypothetical protein
LTRACTNSHATMAPAVRRENMSRLRCATRMPEYASTAKRIRTATVPTRPSSSPMIAKMKSVCASGR